MDEQIATQLGTGVLCIVVGLSGWLVPYRWNILRLRRLFRDALPESQNRMVPKVIGTILIIVGAIVLIATAVIGRLE